MRFFYPVTMRGRLKMQLQPPAEIERALSFKAHKVAPRSQNSNYRDGFLRVSVYLTFYVSDVGIPDEWKTRTVD